MSLLLENKLVFVTGGTRGLGQSIITICAREGADIAFTFMSRENEAEKAKNAVESLGRKCFSYQADVRKPDIMAELAKRMRDSNLVPDVLVNNAGVSQALQFPLVDEEDYDLLMDTNVKGAFFTTQAFARGMISKKKGKIINISSLAGVHLIKAPVHYSTSKAAIVGFTMALSKELGPFGITVNAIAPGLLDGGVGASVPEANLKDFLKHNSLGRLGTCDEIAEFVAFLASDRNSYMNGGTILVDGGV